MSRQSKAREVTAAELAELLNTSVSMINRWRREGKLYRLGHLGSVVAVPSLLPHQPRMYWSDTKTSAKRRKNQEKSND